MELPPNPTLPFFAYGLFRPGQIGYGRIGGFVLASEHGRSSRGKLVERDGLPLIDQGQNWVSGCLLRFDPSRSIHAYLAINSIEQDKLYRWSTSRVVKDERQEEANVLLGRKPGKDCVQPEYDATRNHCCKNMEELMTGGASRGQILYCSP